MVFEIVPRIKTQLTILEIYVKLLIQYKNTILDTAGPGGRAVWGVGFGRLVTRIVASNSARGMSFCVVLSCVLITLPKKSLQVSYKITKSPVWGDQGSYKECKATDDNGHYPFSEVQFI